MRLDREGYVCNAVRNGHLITARDALSLLTSVKDLVLADSALSRWAALHPPPPVRASVRMASLQALRSPFGSAWGTHSG